MSKKTYIVSGTTIQDGTGRYGPGDKIQLDDRTADELLAMGSVVRVPEPKPELKPESGSEQSPAAGQGAESEQGAGDGQDETAGQDAASEQAAAAAKQDAPTAKPAKGKGNKGK